MILLSKAYKDLDEKVKKSETEEWCKVSGKTDSWIQKWHEEFGELYPEQWKVQKVALWWATFVESIVMFKLKQYRGVVSWKMTYGFKNEIRNLVNFHTSS